MFSVIYSFIPKPKVSQSRGNVYKGSFLGRAKPEEQGNTHPAAPWFILDPSLSIINSIRSIGRSCWLVLKLCPNLVILPSPHYTLVQGTITSL